MKKNVYRYSLIFVLFVCFTFCITGVAAEDADVVWWGWAPGSPINDSYIQAFNQDYPDISVLWKQTQVADYDAVLKPVLAGGDYVDAFQMSAGSSNGEVKLFGSRAMDLTDAVRAELGDDYADQLKSIATRSMTVDGQLKGIGVGVVYTGNLWINQDLFDRYDVKVPANLNEWKEACEIFRANGLIGFVQGAAEESFNIDTWHAICDNVAPGMFTKANRGEVSYTDPVFVEALRLWKILFDEGIMQDGALGMMQYPDASNLFLSQKAAMIMMGSWYAVNALEDNMKAAMEAASSTDDPFTILPVSFPDIAGTGHTGLLFEDLDYATAVSVNAGDPDKAIRFALWLGASEKGQQIIADSLTLLPVLKSVSPNWDALPLVNPEKQKQVLQAYFATDVSGADNPRFAEINADLNQAMRDVLSGVASGAMTPEEGAEELAYAYEDSMF